jgi:hypothetical protein
MRSPTLFKLRTRLEKVALYHRDPVDLDAFTDVRDRRLALESAPFPHIIIDDFFKPDAYRMLAEQFATVQRRGFLEEAWSPDYFHRFEIDYDGYVYTPPPTLERTDPLSVFFSLEWNWFFSKLFRQFTTFETAPAFHHHPAGNRTGFVHHDNADKHFSPLRRLPNGVMYGEGNASDPLIRRRKIAILYFLENDSWKEGDGGEVGFYSADGKTLITKVAPLNNRLLAFQISPISQHAFQGNRRERNSIVQWFHAPGEFA